MAKLDGKTCLIAGGTGSVGEAIVKVFLQLGATVVVPSRSKDKLSSLRAYLGELSASAQERLTLLLGNLGEPSGAGRIRDEILSRFGTLHAVVASLGGSFEERQPLLQIPFETFRNYEESNLNAHILTAQTFLPFLSRQPGSSYTLLGGLSAFRPVAGYSPVSLPSAAQLMMAKVLMEEMKGSQVRINQAMFGYIHTRARAAHARPEWITAPEVGEFIAYLASDEARMINGGILQFGDRPPPALNPSPSG
jgi:3-oxoacyl-[acyl-carrier protein] reductase